MVKVFGPDFDRFAEAARILYVYGCFSNVDFDDANIREKLNNSIINSSSGYRKEISSLEMVLEDFIESVRNKGSQSDKGKKQKYISPDRFDDITGLINIYRLNSRNSMDKPINDYINYTYKLSCPDAEGVIIKNKKELIDYFGNDADKKSLFVLDIGKADFTKDEFSQLYSALMFFNGKAPFSIPGYFACDRINDYLKLSDEYTVSDNANVVFNYNNIDRILNDNAVYCIFEAIKTKKWISFFFRKPELDELKKLSDEKKSTNKEAFRSERKYCYPLKIMYEFQNGRGYLIGWSPEYKKIRFYRLDDIFEVAQESCDGFGGKMTKEKLSEVEKNYNDIICKIWLSNSKSNKMSVSIDFDESADLIKKKVPFGTVTPISECSCRYEADINNFKDIVPFLRRFGEKAHISKEGSPELYEYIKTDLKEALKKYGAL